MPGSAALLGTPHVRKKKRESCPTAIAAKTKLLLRATRAFTLTQVALRSKLRRMRRPKACHSPDLARAVPGDTNNLQSPLRREGEGNDMIGAPRCTLIEDQSNGSAAASGQHMTLQERRRNTKSSTKMHTGFICCS